MAESFILLNNDNEKLNEIYRVALDFAMGKEDIHNIALLGPYGSGKTTIWRKYVDENNIKNYINISIGSYIDMKTDDSSKNSAYKDDFSIESQIINQIVAQVKRNSIRKSKYLIKENPNKYDIILNIIVWISMISSILCIFVFSEYKLIFSILTVLSSTYFIKKMLYSSNIKIKKIKISGNEAEFDDIKDEKESILTNNIRELVYILSNCEVNTVVFEDIDRLEKRNLLEKLRELNFIVNAKKKIEQKEPTKFIYMLKDDIFSGKNRTKFFDFIIPVIPIITGNNSEGFIKKYLDNNFDDEKKIENNKGESVDLGLEKFKPDDSTIRDMSLYIDDMRMLKNIINEYRIYSYILKLKNLEVDKNKLFAIIALKNRLPLYFSLLKNKEGYIYDVLANRGKLIGTVNKDLNEQLRDKEQFIKNNKVNKSYSDNSEINNIIMEKIELERKINNNKNMSIRELIDVCKEQNLRVDDIFEFRRNNERYPSLDRQDIEFVKFLIMNDYLDDKYEYYIGSFYSDTLSERDKMFLFNLGRSNEQEIMMPLDNVEGVVSRIKKEDYGKESILNISIIEYLIYVNRGEELRIISDNLLGLDAYTEKFLDVVFELQNDLIIKYVELLYKEESLSLKLFIDKFMRIGIENDKIYKVIERLFVDTKYRDIIKKTPNILEQYKKILTYKLENPDKFIESIDSAKIRFKELRKIGILDSNLEAVLKSRVYDISLDNIRYLIEKMYPEDEHVFESLIKIVFMESNLKEMKSYLEDNFNNIINEYVRYARNNASVFENGEEISIKIINVDLDIEDKIYFIRNNKSKIENIDKISNSIINYGEILQALFTKTHLIFTGKVIEWIENNIESYNINLVVPYLNSIEEIDKEDLINHISLCEKIVGSNEINKNIFDIATDISNEIISSIGSYDKEKICILNKKDLIAINKENLKVILEKGYSDILQSLIIKSNNTIDIISREIDLKKLITPNMQDIIIKYGEENTVVDLIRGDYDKEKININEIPKNKEKIILFLIKYKDGKELQTFVNNINKYQFTENILKELEAINFLDKIDKKELNRESILTILRESYFSKEWKLNFVCMVIMSGNDSINYRGMLDILDNIELKGKRPKINNENEEKIVEVLIKAGIAKKWGKNSIEFIK